MAPRGAEDIMMLCPEVTTQSGEGCWSLPADPTHPPLCSVSAGRPLRTEALRIPGFPLHSASRGHQDEIRGQPERGAGVCVPFPSFNNTLGAGVWSSPTGPAPLARGAVIAPTVRFWVPHLGPSRCPHLCGQSPHSSLYLPGLLDLFPGEAVAHGQVTH